MTGQTARRAAPTARAKASPVIFGGAIDYSLVGVVFSLMILGLVMVFSASFPTDGANFFVRQLMWAGIGTVAFAIMAAVPYTFWKTVAIPFMLFSLVMLVLVLIFGDDRGGARRTLLGGKVQPSEFAKLAVVVYASAWVASRENTIHAEGGALGQFAAIMGIVAGLILAEKSFSVTVIVLVIGFAIFFMGGGNLKQVFAGGLIVTPLLALGMWKSPYASLRIKEWWNVLFNPSQANPESLMIMEMVREGNGIGSAPADWIGKSAVPLLWSDYIFANIGHDLGILGTLGVVALFAAFGYRGLSIALNSKDRFGFLTAIGITAWIMTQAAIHIGTSLLLIPRTGQPLPFLSYGGSSLVMCMTAAGILANISRASSEKKAPYAHFAFGWRNWRSRVPDTRSRERVVPDPKPAKPRARRARHTSIIDALTPRRRVTRSRAAAKPAAVRTRSANTRGARAPRARPESR